jgi:GNAT superfamily N-acetyltransferase
MTTTLRPTEPLQHGPGGARSRRFDVCVNSRPAGTVELATDRLFGTSTGRIVSLSIDEPDRRRGRGCVAALAAEEVLRGWGCRRVEVSVPAEAGAALRLATALGYVERNRNMAKALPAEPLALPRGSAGRLMTEEEYALWLPRAKDEYARNWIGRGVPEAEARAKSERDHVTTLLDGPSTPGMYLGVLTHLGDRVGTLWVSLCDERYGPFGAYILLVEVDEEHRGRGHGRSLMLLAEAVALADGAHRIGLNVFAGNTSAERLYASLGYRPTTHHLCKELL